MTNTKSQTIALPWRNCVGSTCFCKYAPFDAFIYVCILSRSYIFQKKPFTSKIASSLYHSLFLNSGTGRENRLQEVELWLNKYTIETILCLSVCKMI